MNKPLLAALTLVASQVPLAGHAAQAIFVASPDVTTISIVVVDSRKLKTSLPAALAAYPGEECVAFTDVNVVPSCPGFTLSGGWVYALATGFPSWTDPNDPRKDLRIDGLKTKDLVNFLSPGACVGAVCPTAPPPVPLTITFNRPTTEFGFMFRVSWEGQDTTWATGMRLIANGVDLGTYAVAPTGVQYLGVSAPEGLETLTIVPAATFDPSLVGPLVFHRLYTK